MSQTNQLAAICSACGSIVARGCGTIKYWNGAARKYAPSHAKRSAYGILSACYCTKCA